MHRSLASVLKLAVPAILASASAACGSANVSLTKTPERWQSRFGEWSFDHGTAVGHGVHPDGWAYLANKKPLPETYVVDAEVSAKNGVAELALEVCETGTSYVRVYVYTIDKKVAVGAGTVNEGRPDGGETISAAPLPAISDDTWHAMKVTREPGRIAVAVDGKDAIFTNVAPTGCHAWGFVTGSDARFRNVKVSPSK